MYKSKISVPLLQVSQIFARFSDFLHMSSLTCRLQEQQAQRAKDLAASLNTAYASTSTAAAASGEDKKRPYIDESGKCIFTFI